ncbi:DUF2793 domain-containing protein [Pseudooceanicola onchidii]|uniref:DUF2793 domain-containing protein n=1 Tax=Pseudooceanicola onchidii TaxID=2562279 RepID=UPI0010AB1AE3|nr:DUF2793 domain-containing protein [Pseudooceanicola onchidii]
MSDRSANLSLPFILPSQAQKHVTHNEALLLLDALVQLSVLSATDTAAPGAPDPGDRYVVPLGGTGAWSGRDGSLALWDGTGWIYLQPATGWIAWVQDTGSQLRFDGTTWGALSATGETVAKLGINTTADEVNRLSVSAPASLLSHDGAGHQLKINKATAGDTASLLMQTGWSGRAEIGLVGTDDLVFKVSADGSTFQTALTASATTGVVDFPQGATGLTPAALGAPALVTQDYIAARSGLVTNGSGDLPGDWNLPPGATRDTAIAPDLPSAFSFAGHYAGPVAMPERIPVDPHLCYRMRACLRQEGLTGDWSAYANGDRHQHSIGLACFDADGAEIAPVHHKRYRAGGVDSLTTLAAPLAPGDTVVQLTDASGWNDSDTDAEACGILIFGYRTASGQVQRHYSRVVDHGLFVPAGVDKTGHTVTLSSGFPAALANPDNGGIWPVGTPLANTASGSGPKGFLLDEGVPAATDTWYQTTGHIGGLDLSGTDRVSNFAPGTVSVAPVFLPNLSNRPGGYAGHADTGAGHRVWFGGIAFDRDPMAATQPVASGASSGARDVFATTLDPSGGTVTLAAAVPLFTPL